MYCDETLEVQRAQLRIGLHSVDMLATSMSTRWRQVHERIAIKLIRD